MSVSSSQEQEHSHKHHRILKATLLLVILSTPIIIGLALAPLLTSSLESMQPYFLAVGIPISAAVTYAALSLFLFISDFPKWLENLKSFIKDLGGASVCAVGSGTVAYLAFMGEDGLTCVLSVAAAAFCAYFAAKPAWVFLIKKKAPDFMMQIMNAERRHVIEPGLGWLCLISILVLLISPISALLLVWSPDLIVDIVSGLTGFLAFLFSLSLCLNYPLLSGIFQAAGSKKSIPVNKENVVEIVATLLQPELHLLSSLNLDSSPYPSLANTISPQKVSSSQLYVNRAASLSRTLGTAEATGMVSFFRELSATDPAVSSSLNEFYVENAFYDKPIQVEAASPVMPFSRHPFLASAYLFSSVPVFLEKQPSAPDPSADDSFSQRAVSSTLPASSSNYGFYAQPPSTLAPASAYPPSEPLPLYSADRDNSNEFFLKPSQTSQATRAPGTGLFFKERTYPDVSSSLKEFRMEEGLYNQPIPVPPTPLMPFSQSQPAAFSYSLHSSVASLSPSVMPSAPSLASLNQGFYAQSWPAKTSAPGWPADESPPPYSATWEDAPPPPYEEPSSPKLSDPPLSGLPGGKKID